MKDTNKPKYNMWQNVGFLIRFAWQNSKSVLFFALGIILCTVGKNVTELFIAPVILQKLEANAALPELLWIIFLFSAALFLVTAGKGYVEENILHGRVALRMELGRLIGNKAAVTSYPNIMDTNFHRKLNSASRACRSNGTAAQQIWTSLTELIINLCCFILYLFLLSSLNPVLLIVVMITAAANYFISKRFNEWGYRHQQEIRTLNSRQDYLDETARSSSAGKDIRIFGIGNWLQEIWEDTMRLCRNFVARREKKYIWANVVDIVLAFLRNGIAYIYLITQAINGELQASEFLLYFSAVSGFANWIVGILDKLLKLHKESLEFSIIREVLEWPEPFRFESGKPLNIPKGSNCEIKLENVSFRYPEAEKDTITGMNLTIHPGEKLAVVGLNGAGKTTLVRLICGFLDPTEGRVLLNNEDIRQYNRRDYYNMFSAVFQDFLILESSVLNNVTQTVDEGNQDLAWNCLRQAGLADVVQALPNGIHTHIGGRTVFEDGMELSGGQNQRLILARALYKNAPVIVLDEPTAALDPIAENDIYMKYNELTDGRTSVFISHRLASTRFCDRILYLEKGEIKEEGTHEQLMQMGGRYAELFDVQSKYYREGGREDVE